MTMMMGMMKTIMKITVVIIIVPLYNYRHQREIYCSVLHFVGRGRGLVSLITVTIERFAFLFFYCVKVVQGGEGVNYNHH